MRLLRLICISLLILSAASPARAARGYKEWSHQAAVHLPTAVPGKNVYRLILPPPVLGRAREDLGDLRVVDSRNRELPCLRLPAEKNIHAPEVVPARISSLSMRPGQDTVLTVDTGPNNLIAHNAVILETGGAIFNRVCRVEGSDDGRQWAELGRGRIFSLSADRSSGWKSIGYPDSADRYLRLTIMNEGETPLGIDGVSVRGAVYPQTELQSLPVKHLKIVRVPEQRLTKVRLDLGFRNVPSASISLRIHDPLFFRRVEIMGSVDMKRWRQFSSGVLFRYHVEGTLHQRTTIELPARTRFRYLMLVVRDEDGPPLRIGTVSAYGPPASIVFEAPPQERLRLFFGNGEAAIEDGTGATAALQASVKDLNSLPSARLGTIKGSPAPPSSPEGGRRLSGRRAAALAAVAAAALLALLLLLRRQRR